MVIATSEGEVERNLFYLKKVGGKIIVDSIIGGLYSIDAKGIAQQLGNPRAANMVLLGYAISMFKGFESRIFEETILSISPAAFSKLNLEAFKIGFERGII